MFAKPVKLVITAAVDIRAVAKPVNLGRAADKSEQRKRLLKVKTKIGS